MQAENTAPKPAQINQTTPLQNNMSLFSMFNFLACNYTEFCAKFIVNLILVVNIKTIIHHLSPRKKNLRYAIFSIKMSRKIIFKKHYF